MAANAPIMPAALNLLIKIALCNTSNPNVTRLLSVPSDLEFSELHDSIAAAFGWDDKNNNNPCSSWIFREMKSDPLIRYEPGKGIFYSTIPGLGHDMRPATLNTTASIGIDLKLSGPGKFWTYDYDISKFHHAIEVMDILGGEPKICCVGGQGSISLRAWQFGRFDADDHMGADGGKASWEWEMGKLNARMAVVQENYFLRKGGHIETGMRSAPRADAEIKEEGSESEDLFG